MNKVLSVYEMVKILEKRILDLSLNNIYIRGEISNVTYYRNKHLYFSLKENYAGDDYTIKCIVFSYAKKNIPLDLKEGNKVKLFVNVGYYTQTSNLQLVVNKLEKEDNIGILYQEFENRKKLYREKGYFDENLKKPLPKLVKRLGVVTAQTGAAIQDIIKTTHARDENVDIFLFPVKVQGNDAKYEIANAIEYFNKNNEKYNLDAMIVGRGGGSIEDLWAFNEPEVIEAIYNSKIFIVSAVGHETDTLISDYVSDLRASTPTQAAQLLIKVKDELILELENYNNILKKDILNKYSYLNSELNTLKRFFSKNNLINNINNKQIYLNEIYNNLEKNINSKISTLKLELKHNIEIFDKISLENRILDENKNLEDIKLSIFRNINIKLEKLNNEIEKLKLNISKYSSKDILKLGYSILKQDNNVISSKKDIILNKDLEIIFKDGKIRGVINNEKN